MNEAKEMKTILEELIKYSNLNEETTLNLIEWLSAIIDIHPMNSINCAKMNGFKIMLEIIFLTEYTSVWNEACLVFSNMI